MAGFSTVDGVKYDDIFAGAEIPVFTENGALKAGEKVERGQLLAVDAASMSWVVAPKTGVTTGYVSPTLIAAETVDNSKGTGTVTMTAYTQGRFKANRLVVADGDTVESHREELRKVNILLTEEVE